MEEGELLVGRHHHDTATGPDAEPVGHRLGRFGRQLGHQFAPTHTHRARQSELAAHPLTYGLGDGRAVSQQLAGSGHVQEGLIERDAFDQWGHVFEDGVQPPALLHVAVEPSVDEHGRRAQAAGHCRRHGRVHAEHAGLVGAGGHHAAPSRPADDDRQTGQRRIVEDLHRCEEGVHVHMEDDPVDGTSRLGRSRMTGNGRAASQPPRWSRRNPSAKATPAWRPASSALSLTAVLAHSTPSGNWLR